MSSAISKNEKKQKITDQYRLNTYRYFLRRSTEYKKGTFLIILGILVILLFLALCLSVSTSPAEVGQKIALLILPEGVLALLVEKEAMSPSLTEGILYINLALLGAQATIVGLLFAIAIALVTIIYQENPGKEIWIEVFNTETEVYPLSFHGLVLIGVIAIQSLILLLLPTKMAEDAYLFGAMFNITYFMFNIYGAGFFIRHAIDFLKRHKRQKMFESYMVNIAWPSSKNLDYQGETEALEVLKQLSETVIYRIKQNNDQQFDDDLKMLLDMQRFLRDLVLEDEEYLQQKNAAGHWLNNQYYYNIIKAASERMISQPEYMQKLSRLPKRIISGQSAYLPSQMLNPLLKIEEGYLALCARQWAQKREADILNGFMTHEEMHLKQPYRNMFLGILKDSLDFQSEARCTFFLKPRDHKTNKGSLKRHFEILKIFTEHNVRKITTIVNYHYLEGAEWLADEYIRHMGIVDQALPDYDYMKENRDNKNILDIFTIERKIEESEDIKLVSNYYRIGLRHHWADMMFIMILIFIQQKTDQKVEEESEKKVTIADAPHEEAESEKKVKIADVSLIIAAQLLNLEPKDTARDNRRLISVGASKRGIFHNFEEIFKPIIRMVLIHISDNTGNYLSYMNGQISDNAGNYPSYMNGQIEEIPRHFEDASSIPGRIYMGRYAVSEFEALDLQMALLLIARCQIEKTTYITTWFKPLEQAQRDAVSGFIGKLIKRLEELKPAFEKYEEVISRLSSDPENTNWTVEKYEKQIADLEDILEKMQNHRK